MTTLLTKVFKRDNIRKSEDKKSNVSKALKVNKTTKCKNNTQHHNSLNSVIIENGYMGEIHE